MGKIVLEGFDEQLSCRLRRVDGEVVLRGCPFFGSDGHGDCYCMLLMCKETERLQKAEDDAEIIWKYDNILKEVFGDLPPEQHDYKKLSEWKFKDCPICSSIDLVNRKDIYNSIRDVFDKFNFSFEDSKPGGLGHAIRGAISSTPDFIPDWRKL